MCFPFLCVSIRCHSFLFVTYFRVSPCPYTQIHRSTTEPVHPNPSVSSHIQHLIYIWEISCIPLTTRDLYDYCRILTRSCHSLTHFRVPSSVYTTTVPFTSLNVHHSNPSMSILTSPNIHVFWLLSRPNTTSWDHLRIFLYVFFVSSRTQPPHHTYPHPPSPIYTHMWPCFCVCLMYLHPACSVRVFVYFDTVCLFWYFHSSDYFCVIKFCIPLVSTLNLTLNNCL